MERDYKRNWIPPKTLEEKIRDLIVPQWLRIRERAYRELKKGEPELKIIPVLAKNCIRAIDVGANVGVWSYWLAKQVKYVEAFEPNPKIYSSLKSIKVRNINTHDVALSNKSGEEELHVPYSPKGFSNQGATLNYKKINGNSKSLSVKSRCLDEYEFNDVGFIKIDVEGHEHEVIEGATRTIKKNMPNLLVEMEEKHNKIPIDEQIRSIEGLGYKSYVAKQGKLISTNEINVIKLHRHPKNTKEYLFNFIFLPA